MAVKKEKSKIDPIFGKMSANALDSLRFASHIANILSEKEITSMHLFVAIVLNSESIGSRTLVAMGLEPQSTKESFLGDLEISFSRKKLPNKLQPFSPEVKDIVRMAFSIASRYSHVYVGTEHLVMAILELEELEISQILSERGLSAKFFHENLMNYALYPVGILAKPEMAEQAQEKPSPLNLMGEDLVVLAANGKLDPLVGRENELSQLINILSRRRKNNPVIVGEPGVGKTALVEGLAQMIASGNVPNSLQNKKVFSLDIPAIIAGSKLRGDVEEKMIAVIKEVTEATDVILFIDEIHNILGAGNVGGGLDIASVLKPALVRDDFRVIGATTSMEYTRYFESDTALVRRFQPIMVEEPTIDETVRILKKVEPILERHHNVNITEDALVSAAKLSDRYVSDRFLPDKAIDLLDEAAASKRLEMENKYRGVVDVTAKYQEAIREKEASVQAGNMEDAMKWKEREDAFKNELKKHEKSRSQIKNSVKYKVDLESVQKVISKWTGIPVSTINSKEASMLANLEKTLGSKVIGQAEAVEAVSDAIKRARTGISASDRPWASFLFLGPTGVGKTELAKVLTKELFGDEDRLIQIDMSEMMEMHSVSKLVGSPPGYIGYREGGQLTEQVRRYPHSVILFDEIEKAHPDVLNILLQIMEYGHLTDGKGQKVNFKNTVVILTSNIGAEEIKRDKILGFISDDDDDRSEKELEGAYDTMREELMGELKNTLRPELLNRLDDIVIFRSLTKKDARQIAQLLVGELNERLVEQGLKVTLDKKLLDYVVKEGFSDEYGARPLRRILQDKVETAIADHIISAGGIKSEGVNSEPEELEIMMDREEKVYIG